MSIQTFLKKENVDTLWDVIVDEDIFKFLSRDVQGKVFQIFVENIKGFYEIERKTSTNLIDVNKKYILLILNYIKKNYSQQIPNKIKIFEDVPVKESITYEEIQNEKKSQFEKDLQLRQQEFTNAMALPVPEVPEFSDKFTEGPISEMDKMIKEMTAKRNYDVEQINRANQNSMGNADNWLKPQETSVKTEKINSQRLPSTQSRFSSDNEIIDMQPKGKNVTWGENEEFNIPNLQQIAEEDNIFKKLKKVPSNLENITLSMNEINAPSQIEERLTHIEQTLESYNTKMEQILELLQNRNREK
jgi:hypothetical protein